MIEFLCKRFGIDGAARDAALQAYERVRDVRYDAQMRVKANVLAAFFDEGVDESDLAGSTGYGYDDAARERYESLLARIFGCERALARLSFVSGTHAIVTALAAIVPPGKTLLSITGPPYDTLRNAILQAPHNLVESGMRYSELPLLTRHPEPVEGRQARHDECVGEIFDPAEIERALEDCSIAAVFVQRSRGYAPRNSVSIAECERAFAPIKRARPDVAILVDNCYG